MEASSLIVPCLSHRDDADRVAAHRVDDGHNALAQVSDRATADFIAYRAGLQFKVGLLENEINIPEVEPVFGQIRQAFPFVPIKLHAAYLSWRRQKPPANPNNGPHPPYERHALQRDERWCSYIRSYEQAPSSLP
jgi:hypothetical protein